MQEIRQKTNAALSEIYGTFCTNKVKIRQNSEVELRSEAKTILESSIKVAKIHTYSLFKHTTKLQ